jgi:hypothetical protein
MATRHTEGGASASPDFAASDFTLDQCGVVRLPTAAPRRVEQTWNRRTREARKALPQFTGEHISADRRNALKDAAILQDVRPSEALSLALALFFSLDPEGQQRTREQLVKVGSPAHWGALAILLHRRTVGEQLNLYWALERLAGGD